MLTLYSAKELRNLAEPVARLLDRVIYLQIGCTELSDQVCKPDGQTGKIAIPVD